MENTAMSMVTQAILRQLTGDCPLGHNVGIVLTANIVLENPGKCFESYSLAGAVDHFADCVRQYRDDILDVDPTACVFIEMLGEYYRTNDPFIMNHIIVIDHGIQVIAANRNLSKEEEILGAMFYMLKYFVQGARMNTIPVMTCCPLCMITTTIYNPKFVEFIQRFTPLIENTIDKFEKKSPEATKFADKLKRLYEAEKNRVAVSEIKTVN